MKRNRMTYSLCLLILTLAGCGREEPSSARISQLPETEFPDQEGWHSSVTSTKSGKVEAVVEYGHMMRYAKRNRILFDEGVKVDFYDADGRRRSQLTAAAGELNEITNDIIAGGQVTVVSDTGITLFSEKLAYNQKTEKIYSDVDVMLITDKGDTLYGTGFESDKQLHHWRILRPRGSSHKRLDLSEQALRKTESDSSAKASPDTLKAER